MTAPHNPSESVTPVPPAGTPAPAPSTAIQGTPPAMVPPVEPGKKKSKRQPWTPQELAATLSRLDAALVFLVLVLAFFLGAFAIQNGDYWMRLATGRALVQGEYRPGQAVFANVGDNVTWVNHAWLFDLLLYLLYQMAGDPGVVVVKALGLVLLAGFLVAMRRPGWNLGLPAFGATLTLVVLSPRFIAQPMALSYVLLGVTLFLLLKPATPTSRHLWLLPPLFALWANLDSWFLLGPLLVLLVLAGEAAQSRLAAEAKPRLKFLGLVFGVGLLACLANPYLFGVFQLPTELAYFLAPVLPGSLTANGQTVRTMLQYQPQTYSTLSPFTEVYFSQPIGRNPAGMAFFVLFLLSLASFALTALAVKGAGTIGRGLSLQLLMVWLPFAILAALQVRLLGFFAVVAGPILVLNVQDFLAQRFGKDVYVKRPWPSYLIGGRAATVAALLLLLFLAWPGWLHSFPDDPRRSHRVTLQAYADPLWPEAGRRLDALQATGKLKHGFNFAADAANQQAWHAPASAKSIFDQRFGLFAGNVESFGKVRKALHEEVDYALSGKPLRADSRSLKQVHAVFRDKGINYLVLGNLHLDGEADLVFRRLVYDPYQWPLLYLDSHTAIFGWNDPAARPRDNAFAGLRWDFQKQAFGKVAEQDQAPPHGLKKVPEPADWWTHYTQGKTGPAPTTMAVQLYAQYFQVGGQLWQFPHHWGSEVSQWLIAGAQTAVVPAYLGGPTGWGVVRSGDLERRGGQGLNNFGHPLVTRKFLATVDQGPPALPVLAVRAARRAAADAPDEVSSHLAVAEATEVLWKLQEEYWCRRVTFVTGPGRAPRLLTRPNLRFVQFATALHNAVRLEPGNVQARLKLMGLYEQVGYLDLALEQLTEARKHLLAGTATSFPKDMDRKGKELEGAYKSLEGRVKKRLDEYNLDAPVQHSVVKKFVSAVFAPTRDKLPWFKDEVKVDRGLAGLGLKLLKETTKFGDDPAERQLHVQWQLWLMLITGQVKEVQEHFADVKKGLLPEHYEQYRALLAAALGDYDEAQQALVAFEAIKPLPQNTPSATELQKRMRDEHAMQHAAALVGAPLPLGAPGVMLPRPRFDLAWKVGLLGRWVELQNFVMHTAETRLLRGLLALEQGDTVRARELFADGLRLVGPGIDFPDRPIAQRYLELLEKEQK